MSRLPAILKLLERTPNDAELLYAAGMEHKKLGQWDDAVRFFDRTIAADAGYCYAYYQRGQTLEQAGNPAGARDSYTRGLDAAAKKGDQKAFGEIQLALDLLTD